MWPPKKKPARPNARRHSIAPAYSSTSLPAWPGYSLASHPTIRLDHGCEPNSQVHGSVQFTSPLTEKHCSPRRTVRRRNQLRRRFARPQRLIQRRQICKHGQEHGCDAVVNALVCWPTTCLRFHAWATVSRPWTASTGGISNSPASPLFDSRFGRVEAGPPLAPTSTPTSKSRPSQHLAAIQ